MLIELVAYLATRNSQMPEILAGLDVRFRQPLLQRSNNDFFPVRVVAVRRFVLREKGRDLF